uniref:Sugar phosphate transporter domain-containing protein n=1 Tax=Araucaria cunninghamii TaxID=56994 RepID=A0A0D6R2D5_ARACU
MIRERSEGGGSRGIRSMAMEMERDKDRLLPVTTGDASKEDVQLLWKGSAMTKRGAFAALSYMACAVLLVMFNKAVLSSYNFPSANVITLLQMICSIAFLYAMRSWNIISFRTVEGRSIITDTSFKLFIPLETFLRTSPLSIAYLLYMIVGMASIRGVNVPMYTTLRRTTVFFTMVMEYFLSGQKHSCPIVGSVGLILLGAFVAGARDLSFDFYGYMIVIISNITTAIYLITIARIGKSSGLNSFGLMWCNALVCGPVLFLWTFLSGELKLSIHFPHLYSPVFQVLMLLSCMLAFCLNYAIFLNTTLNSALTQTICGNLKDFFTVIIGWVLFGGLPFDWLNVVGQSLGFFGSGVYAYYKVKGK